MQVRRKNPVVEAISFDDLVQHGRDTSSNIVGKMPWSFDWNGRAVSHENDRCYLISPNPGHNHSVRFHPGEMLVLTNDGFAETYLPETFAREFSQLETLPAGKDQTRVVRHVIEVEAVGPSEALMSGPIQEALVAFVSREDFKQGSIERNEEVTSRHPAHYFVGQPQDVVEVTIRGQYISYHDFREFLVVSEYVPRDEALGLRRGTVVVQPDGDDREGPAAQAMRMLSTALQDDPGYAQSWHCNIAMSFFDAAGGLVNDPARQRIANEAAKSFMKLAFGVETEGPG